MADAIQSDGEFLAASTADRVASRFSPRPTRTRVRTVLCVCFEYLSAFGTWPWFHPTHFPHALSRAIFAFVSKLFVIRLAAREAMGHPFLSAFFMSVSIRQFQIENARANCARIPFCLLGNLLNRQPISNERLQQLIVQNLARIRFPMQFVVTCFRQDFKVLNRIVEFISVFVMHVLSALQRSIKLLLHDKTMLVFPSDPAVSM
jgi:hypothetical protein